MPAIPSPSPAGQSAASLPANQAGGGQGYIPSGSCSGTAYTHTQDLTIFYEIITVNRPSSAFPPGCTAVSALSLTVFGGGTNTLNQFSTSAVGGSNSSGCAAAANAMQAHTMAVSSTSNSTGMGSAGTIYTLSGGYSRRWSQIGDVDEQDFRWYTNALFPIDGLPLGWQNNLTLSNEIARSIVRQLCNGGLEYSMNGVAPPQTATPWSLLDFGLIDL